MIHRCDSIIDASTIVSRAFETLGYAWTLHDSGIAGTPPASSDSDISFAFMFTEDNGSFLINPPSLAENYVRDGAKQNHDKAKKDLMDQITAEFEKLYKHKP